MFFINDTATTEIYTYRHTLSLHDALPISGSCRHTSRTTWTTTGTSTRPRPCFATWVPWPTRLCTSSAPHPSASSAGPATRTRPRRSEEHTSELQSLMRISYAVFCLKKKTNEKQTRQTYQRSEPITQKNKTNTKCIVVRSQTSK